MVKKRKQLYVKSMFLKHAQRIAELAARRCFVQRL